MFSSAFLWNPTRVGSWPRRKKGPLGCSNCEAALLGSWSRFPILKMWGCPKMVGFVPPNHPLNNRVFHDLKTIPFEGFTPIFGNTHVWSLSSKIIFFTILLEMWPATKKLDQKLVKTTKLAWDNETCETEIKYELHPLVMKHFPVGFSGGISMRWSWGVRVGRTVGVLGCSFVG